MKSKIFWISLISLIILIFDEFRIWEQLSINKETFQNIAKGVLGFLVLSGILTNHDKNKENNFEGQDDWA
jgi:uncharacterized membrane protein